MPMKSLLLGLSSLSLLLGSVSPALANPYNDAVLHQQRQEMRNLQEQLQIQRNQERIAEMQDEVSRGSRRNPAPVVVVQQQPERSQPSTIGVVLGAVLGSALSNGYVNCGPHGNCSYGYNGGGYGYGYRGGYGYGYRGGYRYNPGRCAYRTGYQGCHYKTPLSTSNPPLGTPNQQSFRETERYLNNVMPDPKPVNDLDRYLGNANINCGNSYSGCAVTYPGFSW